MSKPAKPDPAEHAVDRITKKSARLISEEDRAKQSVFDEPDIFPGREPETITQDWTCSNCGYNLRGLSTGHRCPECGHLELYRPPPTGEASYGSWYRRKKTGVTSLASWTAVILTALFAALMAVPGAFLLSLGDPVAILVMAPAMEEALKILAVVLLVDAKPFLIRRGTQIWVAAIMSAIAYAVVHNATSFSLFITAPPLGLILGRWIGGPVLHAACTAIAASGVVAAWQMADHEGRRLKLSKAARSVCIAIILHAGLNALLFFWGAGGYAF